MNRKMIAATVLTVAVGLTACGSSGHSSAPGATSTSEAVGTSTSEALGTSTTAAAQVVPTTAATSTTAALPAASSLTLQLSDLPVGWSVDTSATSAPKTCETLDTWFADQKPVAASTAQVRYVANSQGIPELIDGVIVYKSATTAASAYATVSAQLAGCKTFHGSISGSSFSGTVKALSLGSYGDRSSAFLVTTTVDGTTVGQDEVFILSGQKLGLIAYGDINPNPSTTEGFAAKAAAKLG